MSKLPTARVIWKWVYGVQGGPSLVFEGFTGPEYVLNGIVLARGPHERHKAPYHVRAINLRRLAMGLVPIVVAFWDR